MDLNKENTAMIMGRIIARSINGSISADEQALLDEWLKIDTKKREYETLRDEKTIGKALNAFESYDVAEGYERFQLSTQTRTKPWHRKWVAIAASVLALLSLSVIIYTYTRRVESPMLTMAPSGHDDIAPGGNRATLTLANGQKISLDDTQQGIIIHQGEIVYNDGKPLAAMENMTEEPGAFFTLSTPKGGTYQITLPDGTEVWLNALSTLTYPNRFSDTERKIELIGEAYLSVVKDTNRTFKVISEGQEVQVLGTEFNITAYPDEDEIKTTLVNGSVRLSVRERENGLAIGAMQQIDLMPGEQSVIRKGSLTKTPVDTELYTAWKDGYFYFKSTPLSNILKQAERWYDIDIVYEGEPTQETFSGDIKRDVSLRGLLEILHHSTINATLEGRTLTIHN